MKPLSLLLLTYCSLQTRGNSELWSVPVSWVTGQAPKAGSSNQESEVINIKQSQNIPLRRVPANSTTPAFYLEDRAVLISSFPNSAESRKSKQTKRKLWVSVSTETSGSTPAPTGPQAELWLSLQTLRSATLKGCQDIAITQQEGQVPTSFQPGPKHRD